MNVVFPNDVVWAFNPVYIQIEGADCMEADVIVGDNPIVAALYKGSADVYITRLLQLAFDNPKTTRTARVHLKVVIDGNTFESDVTAVWGNIELGDRFAQFGVYRHDAHRAWLERTVQYFKNFPFTIDLFVTPGSTITARKDLEAYHALSVDTSATAIKSLPVGSGATIEPGERQVVIRQEPSGVVESGVFDETFDYTFRTPDETTVITKIVTRPEKEGVYIRWIDRFGCMQYYMFVSGEKEYNTEKSNYNVEGTTRYGNLFFADHKHNIRVSTQRTLKVCAVNLDAETLSYVESIIGSPFVDMYLGKTKQGVEMWLPVQPKGNMFKVATYHTTLQDFEITLELPERISQSL